MRRKGQAPFGRRPGGVPKSPHRSHQHLSSGGGGVGGGSRGDMMMMQQQQQPGGGDAYGTMQRGLADGMNHIAKSIMHSSGRGGIMSVGGGGGGGDAGIAGGGIGGQPMYLADDGDLVSSSTGELQTPRRENIPMRPLMMNGQQQQQQQMDGYE